MTKITRALISVSDKTNLDKIANYLADNNIEIISTGGTCKKIQELGTKVTEVSNYTNFPEIMDGRVKTLNPYIYGGILANRNKKQHHKDLKENNINLIDLVIVNLYPFESVVAQDVTAETAIENIDIGGPTMVRAAAKNHEHMVIITDPNDYDELITELTNNNNSTSLEFRKRMALKAFARTAAYDHAIYNWMAQNNTEKTHTGLSLNNNLNITAQLKQKLRYGENPHQTANLYLTSQSVIGNAKQLQGKELSYNNIADSDSAVALIQEFSPPAAAIIKHANPCGVACANNITDAFKKAFSCDPVSSFGGIVALNRTLDAPTAEIIKKTFFEVVIAPEIDDTALEILKSKKNMRILCANYNHQEKNSLKLHSIQGGILAQSADDRILTPEDFHYVTKRKPTDQEIADLLFAFKAVKHVRSNAILFAQNEMSIAIGAGQMSRVDSVKIAGQKLVDFKQNNPEYNCNNLVLASDAFFPFADSITLAMENDIKAIIQPGGSIRDDEVIAKADECNIAMIFTKVRHFKH